MPQEFYNEAEAEEILRLATRQQFNGGVTREALMRMASEVGLTENEVAAAEIQFRTSNDEQELEKRFEKRQRANFVAEALSYLGVNGFMVAVWWMTGRGSFWPGWVIFGTICFGGLDAIPKHLMPASSAYQKAFEKWKAKGAPVIDSEEEEEQDDHVRASGLTIGISTGRRNRRKRRSE